ncbi:MAG: GNAT family N-acetyltransferase, partial [Candidatus Devosia euplotis]|nr:GNAT family N-acetyltransferase [Candidatus Devosia euplotis]
ELQNFEHKLDARVPTGAAIVDDYVAQMFERARQADGKIIVAEVGNDVAGFVAVMARVSSGEIQDGDYEYAQITDLVVAPEFRRRGIGQKLLEAGEHFARSKSALTLRIGVLEQNRGAMQLYTAGGFDVLYSELEKSLQQ